MTLTDPDTDFTTQREIPDNLVPDLTGVNAFTTDAVAASVVRAHAPWAWGRAEALGAKVWDPRVLKAARDAQRFTPELRTLDRLGHEVYDVDFHPAYHELMALGFGSGTHSLAWTATEPGGHAARAVLSYLWNQVDGSTACPVGMAYASIPVLRDQPELAAFARAVEAEGYDAADVPVEQKSAATIGYFMTEKHGGSDLRANVTVARPVGRRGPGERYLVNGHKWFASVPMADGYLTVAHTEGGVSCLFVPRRLPDGDLNRIRVNRLKDKLGNRANASSEIEYHDAEALLVGEEGRGISTILSSAEYTRLDFAVGSAGLMRAALSQALHHNDHRSAFGAPLSQLPIQAPVLADLALEWAGAAHLGFRVARAEDHRGDVSERLVSRLLTPVAKFWNCRRVAGVTEEVMQSIGGNAYIEEHPCPRYYREAPLNAIWEGTSNMMVMDVGRVLAREPKAIEPVLDEIRPAAAGHPLVAAALAEIEELVLAPEQTTRYLVTRIALAAQAALLLEHAPTAVAEAFVASRLGTGWGPGYGTLRGVDFEAVIDFARLS
ncbi:acyl-CoA dehydrogenase family protein [Pseudonocardia sp. KRD-184]|uniref:Acyl-CoA dehydrogenase family protein n=1 Tax=Pseudonocardia oceani TaxID=2792013 RepID=A0ABS6U3C6_9PSEU|nr:acyl-CoA dehydrogenase family protein [Pseudonocardia oceani]MBW0090818.1 acyl-CoA dehydrogenase family protein [Pseudonocardia oceani]MBW0096344.1 acyl-CoA dehydrogenase family protein [Pseudonocardia oceani]MBW0109095.1 acyl-CoA dehydrogenase family protein [Pseudonocardia oceani]MBW0122960.1 acyl-CoA dehydrogenase family protein [Pseudonocardia oceani]MBW0126732.1 acyl-CoA dehydrogenase family protein [Pseudonocardia oceani]